MRKKFEPGELSDEQIFDKLIRYCDYQERCKKEIYDKAKILGVEDHSKIDKLIEKLEESGFLNEERFVRSFVRGKLKIKKWGRKRIQRELRFKNIPEELYRIEIDKLEDEDYRSQFEELAERKWEKIKGKSLFEKKSKLYRFLYSRGYENDMIKEYISKL